VLDDKLIERVVTLPSGEEVLPVDSVVLRALQKEQERRQKNRATIERLIAAEASLRSHPVVIRWADDSRPLPEPFPSEGTYLHVYRVAADPAHVNERIEFKSHPVVRETFPGFQWDNEDLYGYGRAFTKVPELAEEPLTILDPTAGGGSIPFEALRLGHRVVANDLNPVAAVILHATLDFPLRFGKA